MPQSEKSFRELYRENQRAAEAELQRDPVGAPSCPTITLTEYVGEGGVSTARLAFDADRDDLAGPADPNQPIPIELSDSASDISLCALADTLRRLDR